MYEGPPQAMETIEEKCLNDGNSLGRRGYNRCWSGTALVPSVGLGSLDQSTVAWPLALGLTILQYSTCEAFNSLGIYPI
jgi:hypothetical protein